MHVFGVISVTTPFPLSTLSKSLYVKVKPLLLVLILVQILLNKGNSVPILKHGTKALILSEGEDRFTSCRSVRVIVVVPP